MCKHTSKEHRIFMIFFSEKVANIKIDSIKNIEILMKNISIFNKTDIHIVSVEKKRM